MTFISSDRNALLEAAFAAFVLSVKLHYLYIFVNIMREISP